MVKITAKVDPDMQTKSKLLDMYCRKAPLNEFVCEETSTTFMALKPVAALPFSI